MDTRYAYHRILFLYAGVIIAFCIMAAACGRDKKLDAAMDRAESVMSKHPDSALRILETHRPASDASERDIARHSLLTAMARDKSLIVDTNFKYLQPAIDYYAEGGHGTPDERLRTFFYQGRIHMDRLEYEESMRAFQRGHALKNEVTDSLTLANLAYEQGKLYYTAYRIPEYRDNNKAAARIYDKLDSTQYEIDCLNQIGRAALLMNDKALDDSVVNVLQDRVRRRPEFRTLALPIIIGCKVNATGNKEEVMKILRQYENDPSANDDALIEIAYGYLKIKEMQKSADIIDRIHSLDMTTSLKYYVNKGEALHAIGRDKEAADALLKCVRGEEDWLEALVYNNLSFADEHFILEQENQRNIEARRRTVAIACGIVVFLIFTILLILLKLKNKNLKAKIQEIEKERLESENKRISGENENLVLAKANAELEAERQMLDNENLRLQVSRLEADRDALQELLDSPRALTPQMKSALEERIRAMNNLLAYEITNRKAFLHAYEKWKKRMMSNSETLLREIRLFMTSDNPEFISRLEEMGLDEQDIECLCLYALGMSGREIGDLLQDAHIYRTSSELRKKLKLEDPYYPMKKFVQDILGSKTDE